MTETKMHWIENSDEDFAEKGDYKLVVEQMDDWHFYYGVFFEDHLIYESWDDTGRTTSRAEARRKAVEQMEIHQHKTNY
jgi:hypothetical protein